MDRTKGLKVTKSTTRQIIVNGKSYSLRVRDAFQSRRYIRDILSGLVPTDTLYDPIYETVAAYGGVDLSRVSDKSVIAMGDAIQTIRVTNDSL